MILKRLLFSLFLLQAFSAPSLWAQEISYDRYGEEPSAVSETVGNWGRHFLVYPFELIRWPADRTLVFIEKHHLYDKVDWIYDQMKNRGVTPKIRSLLGGDSLGGGFDIEFLKLSRLKENFPNTTVEGKALWTLDSIVDYRAHLLQEGIAGTGLKAGTGVNYENRGEEHFYGIGPNTSLGDGTSYRMERSTFETTLGWQALDHTELQGRFAYQNVNITNGEDGGRGIIDNLFVATGRQRIPGLGGDEILSWGADVEHDTRDNPDIPVSGGYERAHFSFNKGLKSDSGYFKYRGEIAHFFKVFSERQVLALRGVVEHHDEVGDRAVPFFHMSRLGGFGTSPRMGDTHRGFRRDRFYDESLLLFNVEYRWTVWQYREWRMDAVLLWDEGQVFGEWSNLQLEDFRGSYGLGFRISFENSILLAIEMARSNEGTEFYVKTKAPF